MIEPTGKMVRCRPKRWIRAVHSVATPPVRAARLREIEQTQRCLEAAGSSLDHVLKCNVHRTSVETFAAVDAVSARYVPKDPPARIFVCVPAWPGRFDIEIDCIAARGDA